MAKKIIFNIEALVCVEIHDKRKCNYFTWLPEKKFLFSKREEGFYDSPSSYPCSKEYLESGKYLGAGVKFLVEDKTVYYKPYVRLSFAGRKSAITEFATYELAHEYGMKMANRGIAVQLIDKDEVIINPTN